jgi:arginine/lysine/ornithine decarboxylase
MRLVEALEKIKAQHLVSFFMPGHKMGRKIRDYFPLTYENDITEIPGADYLHDPTGAILETEQLMKRLYGSMESKMLVGGSTVGILSMIMGAAVRGDTIIVNRNAHKSVYHAIEMGGLNPVYLIPEMDTSLDIPIAVSASSLEVLIKTTPHAKLCVLTYPTYEGICFDLKACIDVCHRHGVAVLVDEAHGAHLMLNDKLPASALTLGADVVVQSFHKTLPALTQTACLHFGSQHKLTDRQIERIKWHLKALQTSSPSYLLMGSIDGMLSLLENQGRDLMAQLMMHISAFEYRVKEMRFFAIHRYDGMDWTKLLLVPQTEAQQCCCSGHWLAEALRNHFGIQVEYATDKFCLLMTSIGNNEADFEKLEHAIKALDGIAGSRHADKVGSHAFQVQFEPFETMREGQKSGNTEILSYISQPEIVYSPSEARMQQSVRCPLNVAEGAVSQSYIIPYPPGIPILVPGERITGDKLIAIEKYRMQLMSLPKDGIDVIK